MFESVQPVLAYAAAHLDEDLSLEALAAQARLSAFHLHRKFSAAAGETPKQFTLRLRLDCAAALLVTRQDSVLDVALSCGFQSHEAFCRAFRRRFGMTPSAYRARGLAAGTENSEEHAALVRRVGPCLGFFHTREGNSQRNDMSYSIEKKQLFPQPVLVVKRRVKPSELAAALGEMFGRVFLHAQQTGAALAGAPFARYLECPPGLWTIEAGFPVVQPGQPAGDIAASTLPGGPAAVTTHAGPYDKLSEAHAAIQQWMEAHGLAESGAPWESYITDPANFPDPKDWKTEVFFPLAG